MADGLLAQEFGGFDRALPEAFQYAQGYNNVLQRAIDTIELRKQQEMRSKFNDTMLDKAQQMSPLEIMKAKAEAAKAEAGSTPDMLRSFQKGYMAQNDLQDLAARRSAATHENRVNAENAEFGSEAMKSKLQNQIRQHIDLSQNPDVPENIRVAALQQVAALTDAIARHDPSFLQKSWLQDDRLAGLLEKLREQSALKATEPKPEKPMTLSQTEAKYRALLAQDPTNQEAKAFLDELERYKQSTAAGMADVTLDPATGKLMQKRTALGGGGPQAGTKDNPIKLD